MVKNSSQQHAALLDGKAFDLYHSMPYTLTDAARAEIIKYCSEMIADNKDTELYVLSDDVIAFVMCERYSEESLLGSFSFLEKGKDGAYKLRTVVDFNC